MLTRNQTNPPQKLDLQTRLLLSHLVVMVVGLSILIGVGRISTPQIFVWQLRQLEGRGIRVGYRYELEQVFQKAWSRGALWSVLVGGGAAGGLSYWLAKRITEPLDEIQEATQRFAKGELESRLPESEILELNELATSFNAMALRLENVEQRRRELVGDLTHELRTPLTVLNGYLEGMVDGAIAPNPEVFTRLTQETKRLGRLVEDFQTLSKAEAGYLPIQTSAVAVEPLLRSLRDRFADQLLEDGPELRLDCPADLPSLQADRARVEQILVNLLGNAIRHTPQGAITLRAWTTPGQLWIAVADTGQGIAEAELAKVFERFWRSDKARTRDGQGVAGSGIGLAIARRLVELQGGEIQVSSTLGQGSEFRFWLPMSA